MKEVNDYLEKIENLENRSKLANFFDWIYKKYPNLDSKIAWNQPMFTHNGTFIIGFSVAKAHFAVAIEEKALNLFREKLDKQGYKHSLKIFRVKWEDEINYDLFSEMIEYNIEDKKGYSKFWR